MTYFLSDGIETVVRGKWLLWDTCALIRVTDCESDALLNYLRNLVAENVTIKPVLLELSATQDQALALKRADYTQRYISAIIKLNIDTSKDKTGLIQASLPRGSQPGAVDLMLASTLAQYGSGGKMLLVTENVKDFPEPLFIKRGFIMVSSERVSYVLTLLQINALNL